MAKQKNQIGTKINWTTFHKRIKASIFRPKKQIRDTVFRTIFGQNKKALLELCNGLNGSNYTDENEIRIVTLDNAIYVEMKNDVAFILCGSIILYEHQSTNNPNMPLRFLVYLASEYQAYVESAKQSIYGNTRLQLPTPQCVVFFNGTDEMGDEEIYRLSDAFQNKEIEPSVEVKVRVININYGHNEKLMKACELLEQYAKFVAVLKEYQKESASSKEAINNAINYCIEQHILEDILRRNRGEIMGSLLETFDKKKYENTVYEEGKLEGLKQGLEQGTILKYTP